MNGTVYFIKSGSRIKIGYSTDVKKRIRSMATGNPDVLSLIGSVKGSFRYENAIQNHLNKFRVRGEWFRDCDEVRDLIALVQKDGPSAIGFVDRPNTRSEDQFFADVREKITEENLRDPIDDMWDALEARLEAIMKIVDEAMIARRLERAARLPKFSLVSLVVGGKLENKTFTAAFDVAISGLKSIFKLRSAAHLVSEDGDEFILAQAEGIVVHAEQKAQALLKYNTGYGSVAQTSGVQQ